MARTSAAPEQQEDAMTNASQYAAFLLLFSAMGTSPAMAQSPVEGAYERMESGNQKIARALFEAQVPNTIPVAAAHAKRGAASTALSLDQIASLKQGGQAWGHVFQAMRTRGLLLEDNLAQVMSKYEQRRLTNGVVATTARAHPKTRPEHAFAD
jgi:hypothetical protein